MSAYFDIYLDGILLDDDPIGVDDFAAAINRDLKERRITITYPQSITFVGDGYDYLRGIWDFSGFCQSVTFLARKYCNNNASIEIKGKIFIADITFRPNLCEAEVEIKDDSFISRINNNLKLETNLNSTLTKNEEIMSACPAFSLNVFDENGIFGQPSGGSLLTNEGYRRAFDVNDVFAYLINYMSDEEVGYDSDFWDSGALNSLPSTTGVTTSYALVTGRELRLGSGVTNADPTLSFDQLFNAFSRWFNLMLTPDRNTSGDPIIRIEDINYFYQADTIISKTAIKDIDESTFQDLLYSRVKFGTEGAGGSTAVTVFPDITFFGWNEENYNVQGECNIDIELDLTDDVFIVDTNVIFDVLQNGNTDYDDNIFVIQYNRNTGNAEQRDNLNIGGDFYNQQLTNNKIAERYNLQGSIAKYLGNGNDVFLAKTNADTIFASNVAPGWNPPGLVNAMHTISPVVFQSELSDPNNNYNPANGRYTCPANGVYTFRNKIIWALTAQFTDARITVTAERFDSGNNSLDLIQLHQETRSTTNDQILNGIWEIPLSFQLYMDATDYVVINVEFYLERNVPTSVVCFAGCYQGPYGGYTVRLVQTTDWECTATTNGGGVYQISDRNEYFAIRYEFNEFLSDEEQQALLSQPFKRIEIQYDPDLPTIKTWPKSLEVNLLKGNASFEQITNKENLQ